MSPHISKRQGFGFTCSAGTWYACNSGSQFVGCCEGESDPCLLGCAEGNIRPGRFNPNQSGKFPDASCGTGGRFYACVGDTRTFWGCCKTNPCSNGQECPTGDLVPAFVDLPSQILAYQATGAATSSTASATTAVSTGSPTTITSATSASASGTSTSVSANAIAGRAGSEHPKNIAVIAGGAAGGVGLAVLVGLLVYFIMHTRKSRCQHLKSLERRQSDLSLRANEKTDKGGSPMTEAPPTYNSLQSNVHAFPHSPPYSQQHAYEYSKTQHHELPAAPSSPRNTWQPQRPHRSLDLPSNPAQLSELESPVPSPRTYGTPSTPGSPAGDEPNWATHAPHRRPEQALGITGGNAGSIEKTRDQTEFGGYHAL